MCTWHQTRTGGALRKYLPGHSASILRSLDNEVLARLYGIDPYIAGYDPEDIFAVRHQSEFDAMYTWVDQRMKAQDPQRFRLLRTDSKTSKENVQELIHAVFIDGDHRDKAVEEDLASWYPKLHVGGLVVGDDYHHFGVAVGVENFFKRLSSNDQKVPKLHILSRPNSNTK
jgi:hypothetical protein